MATIPEKTESAMDDVDVADPNHPKPLQAADLNWQAGIVGQTKGVSDDQGAMDVTAEDVDIGSLDIVDHEP